MTTAMVKYERWAVDDPVLDCAILIVDWFNYKAMMEEDMIEAETTMNKVASRREALRAMDAYAEALGASPASPETLRELAAIDAARIRVRHHGAKAYLAAQFARRDELAAIVSAFEEAGVEITSRWLAQATPLNGRMDNHTADQNAGYASKDWADILGADTLVLFTEDPTVGIPRGGRHVETGLAMAWGKRVAIVGPRENVFHWLLPDYAVHSSVSFLLEAVAAGDVWSAVVGGE